jgi:hypothetical protein
LNKSILDQGGFEFRRQLDYKLAWNGGWLIAVPPRHDAEPAGMGDDNHAPEVAAILTRTETPCLAASPWPTVRRCPHGSPSIP